MVTGAAVAKVIRNCWRAKLRPRLERIQRRGQSIAVVDAALIAAFTSEPSNTFLVSFPRTGSHWLRMLLELYFERPSLVRTFYYPERSDYLLYHTHDLDLAICHDTVVYLYRNPVNTIFSQLAYHREDYSQRSRIAHWADLYGQHLEKWLHIEDCTRRKTVVTYEGLRNDLQATFRRLAAHFGAEVDLERLREVALQVTPSEVRSKSRHDPQVMQLDEEYERLRQQFTRQQGDFVWETVLADRPLLRGDFEDSL